MITAEQVKKLKLGYSKETLSNLFPGKGLTAKEVATKTDGVWKVISSIERLDILTQLISGRAKREFLARILERRLNRYKTTHKQSAKVLAAIRDNAVTDKLYKEISGTYAKGIEYRRVGVAYAAVNAVLNGGEDPAKAAFFAILSCGTAAKRRAEIRLQLKDLMELFE